MKICMNDSVKRKAGCSAVTFLGMLFLVLSSICTPGAVSADSKFKLYGEESVVSEQSSQQARKYKVLCHLKIRSVIFEDVSRPGWKIDGKKEMAGPFPTGKEAILWSRMYCPSGLCTAEGKCRRKNPQ